MENSVPSPFWENKDEKLCDALDVIFKAHGYKMWGFVAAKEDENEEEWSGHSNVISEGMIEYTRMIADWMEEHLDDHHKED